MNTKHYRIFLSPPQLAGNEWEYLQKALQSNWIAPAGDFTADFEWQLCQYQNIQYGLALNSGTSALHLALKAVGVGAGDEVICPTFTFVATANAIRYLGAFPIFIDAEELTWNLCPEITEEVILKKIQFNQKPKAIVITHVYGQPAQMDKFLSLSQQYDIALIEDAAEALGSHFQGVKMGSWGKVGIVSFNGNKIITTSAGGALFTEEQEIFEKVKHWASQSKKSTIYFEHDEIGYNYRLSNLLAAVGLAQLEKLTKYIEKKRNIYQIYRQTLEIFDEVTFLAEIPQSFSNRWLSCLLLKDEILKEKILINLQKKGIESRNLWTPLHLQKPFKSFTYFGKRIAEVLTKKGLCLPSGVGLTTIEQQEVIDKVSEMIIIR